MPDLIVIKLTPANPTSGEDFTKYLTNLNIKAFDLSFGEPKIGVLIGHASGAWFPPSDDPTDPGLIDFSPATPTIFQHFSFVTINPIGPVQVVKREAVATAVIAVRLPSGHTEYQTADLRLEITNNGRRILDQHVDFNVAVISDPFSSTNPAHYINLPITSVFFALPDSSLGLDPTVAFVDLPSDGTAPSFKSVFDAANLVLAQDPGGGGSLAKLSPLSAARARQVAREILWNPKLNPAPLPLRPLEELYTRPPTNPNLKDDALKQADMDRKQFEATLMGFHATQDAHSDLLAKYVFAASAAVRAEQKTTVPSRVGFFFPVDPTNPAPTSSIREAEITLVAGGGFSLNFEVPAPYFYALSASLATSVTAEQRYRMATLQDEERIVSELQVAIDSGIIDEHATIKPPNAARRLVALGSADTAGLPQCPLNAEIDTMLKAGNGWLAFPGTDIGLFWAANPFPAAHLDLVLSVVTQQFPPLIDAIKLIPVNNVQTLKTRTAADWHRFFIPVQVPPVPPNSALLPPFTAPGTPEERVAAFIRHLRKFFEVQAEALNLPSALPANAIPSLAIADSDPINAFVGFYDANGGPAFAFGSPSNQAFFDQAVLDVFPGDTDAQAWLGQTLRAIDDLFRMTTGVGPATLQFSLMEALYARGFDSMSSVQGLSLSEFEQALTGTVAYAFANSIYTGALGRGGSPSPGPGAFKPVNPDGSLVNCIPPWHLSPLGPVEYLHELLKVSAASTCDDPAPSGSATLGTLLAGRRGDIGSLHATAANVHTPLPLIDLVNENLEALASSSTADWPRRAKLPA